MSDYLTKDGQKFIIRRPTEKDAEGIIYYSKILFASTDQVLTMPEEYTITVPEEKVWIANFARHPNSLVLIAERNSQIIGLLFFIPGSKKKNAHTGEFGVNVHPQFQGTGIGRQLIMTLLDWAKENKTIEKIFLQVFASNQMAISLYKTMGFIEEGRHVNAIKQPSGEYVDILQMYIGTK
jgi:RimJ/RimL family protein N-acetyltransferase